jgi:hypothetical protein
MITFRAAKLARFFNEEFKDTSKILIVAGQTGYELFGRFKIEFNNSYFCVSDINSNKKVELSSLKHAVTWCILTDSSKHDQSQRLHLLDLKLSSLSMDTMIHRNKLKSAITDSNRLLYKIKLREDSYKRKLVIQEIDTYIKNSKILYTMKTNPKKQPIFKYKR